MEREAAIVSREKAKLVHEWPRENAQRAREVIGKLNLCSCGTNAHWECILELLEEASQHTKEGFYRDKWFEFGAKVLDSNGLIEHGTGIGFAWLTDDGKLLLKFLRDFGVEEDESKEFPGWSTEFSWSSDKPKRNDAYGMWATS